MGQVWRFPLQPQQNAASATPVTAAALTASGVNPLPQLPVVTGPGGRLVLKAHGEVTCTSSTPTCAVGFYMGSVGQAIGSKLALGVTAALAISASAVAWPFDMEYHGTVRAEGSAAGTIHGFGIVTWWGNVGLTGTGTANPMPATAAARTISTANFSQVNEFDVGVTLSATTGTPSVTITDLWAELSG